MPPVDPHTAAPLDSAVRLATERARDSPCAKSQRGAVVYHPAYTTRVQADGVWSWQQGIVLGSGQNGVPMGACTGTDACRAVCGKVCVHAEQRAIADATGAIARLTIGHAEDAQRDDAEREWWSGAHLVHVKVGEDGQLVAGGGPSCWQCSRIVADVGLGRVWLYERTGALVINQDVSVDRLEITAEQVGTWRGYTAAEFHRATLRNCKLEGPAL